MLHMLISTHDKTQLSHVDLHIAHGSLEEGIRSSSMGLAASAASILTTPQVDVDSATEQSSGMKASPPSVVRFGSRLVRFSALDCFSISLY